MKKNNQLFMVLTFCMLLLAACQGSDESSTGSEYMPDMAHSVAYEANVYNYYYQNTWDSASVLELKELSMPRLPVKGTVPRGYAGFSSARGMQAQSDAMDNLNGVGTAGIAVPVNGYVPYNYVDTEEDRTRAGAELVSNPFPITTKGLERGKELYEIFCGICHGDAGGGNGGIYESGIYPAAPANFLNDEFVGASNGRYYHAIMFGKNVMGAYADKISYEERWQVIHYIRALQAKEKKVTYTAEANTLNAAFGTPASRMSDMADMMDENTGGILEEEGAESTVDGGSEGEAGMEAQGAHNTDGDKVGVQISKDKDLDDDKDN